MKPRWKTIGLNVLWISIAISGVVLLAAAITKRNGKECKAIDIGITAENDRFFVDEKEIAELLNANGKLIGSPLEGIKLGMLEKRLENDRWIRNAELFFDNNQVLQVQVEENVPVARIFTIGGYSYYIDSSCKKLPLSDRLSARVPMFTGFPSDRARWSNVDSGYMAQVKQVALYISQNAFWTAQTAQLNINSNREIEMIPTIGNHTVLLGKPTDIEEKLNRLYSFYKQVWIKVGLERYETIDVRFTGQVVATKKGTAGALIDSAKAQQAIEDLMKKGDGITGADIVANNSIQKAGDAVINKHTVPAALQKKL